MTQKEKVWGIYIYMLTLDVVKSCHMVAGNELLSLEVWSEKGGSLPLHKLSLSDEINIICPHMEYEVVVYKQGTGNWKFLGMKMCGERKEEIMKCNYVKRWLSSGSQEDVTRRYPSRICRL